MAVAIWVGTTTGTAQFVAEEVAAVLQQRHETQIFMMEDVLADPLAFVAPVLLIVCSTFGIGDMPDGAHRLHMTISRARPDLSNVCYAVISLGDSSYKSTFAAGGRKWDRILAELGAQAVQETLILDAQALEGPEVMARQWARRFDVLLMPAGTVESHECS